MDSPLTSTITNCHVFFFERDIIKTAHDNSALYRRYIVVTIIVINWIRTITSRNRSMQSN
jgi:hypothetical protein